MLIVTTMYVTVYVFILRLGFNLIINLTHLYYCTIYVIIFTRYHNSGRLYRGKKGVMFQIS